MKPMNGFSLFKSISTYNHLYIRLCEGGELFEYITEKKHLTEAEAAQIAR